MNAKTEEFLYLLLWGAETLERPTFHNLTEAYEGWADRQGLRRHLRKLEARQLVEKQPGQTVALIYRLTEAGRLAALGHRDPEAHWTRPWDGQWRMVVFDVPEHHNAARVRLRRYLKSRGYGYLQRSVWITPDPVDHTLSELAAEAEDAESLLTLQARPCSGKGDQAIVAGAWDFGRVNQMYQQSLRVLQQQPTAAVSDEEGRTQYREWARLERSAWQAAMRADPLLPLELLPSGYLGREAWRRRGEALQEAGRWLRRSEPV